MEIKIPEQLRAKLQGQPELCGVTITAITRFGKLFASSGTPFFRNYTDHGPKHVSEVLETSFRLISTQAWDLVTPQDAAVLILAVLLHDAALHLQEDGFLQLLESQSSTYRMPEFDALTWAERWDEFRAKISRLDRRKLREIFGTDEPIDFPDLRRPENWTQLQFDFIGEFLRTHHARLAHEIARFGVPGPSDDPLDLAGLDATFADLAGVVARSHGMPPS